MPSSAATTRMAISVTMAPLARMEVNASWPGGIQEGDGLAVDLHLIGADVLGDTAGLAAGHMGVADIVQQTGLAVVHMTHDHHHGGTGYQILLVVLVVVDELLLDGDHYLLLHLAAHLLCDDGGGIEVNELAQGGHDAVFIRHLTTSAPVFFMRLASSPTLISSGICTVTGVF